ncbi:MAG: hypothetical protein ACR2L3_04230 [Actinomycetota bacterium]
MLIPVIVAIVSFPLPAAADSGGVDDLPSIMFTQEIDTRLAGSDANWVLSTDIWPDATMPLILASGVMPTTGRLLQVSIPLSEAVKTTSSFFSLNIFGPIVDGHRYQSGASEGVDRSELTAGRSIAFAEPVVDRVPVYASAEEAAHASGCNDCFPSPSPAIPESELTAQPLLMAPPEQGIIEPPDAALPGTGLAGASAPLVPPTACESTNSCGESQKVGSSSAAAASGTECSRGFGTPYTRVCTIASYNIAVGAAFRGFPNKVPGDNDVFKVHRNNKQKWDNGYRVNAGPFTVNGSTVRTEDVGFDINYRLRGDCWNPPQPGDDVGYCDGTGYHNAVGDDTWRWRKREYSSCLFILFFGESCFGSSTAEELFQTSFNGGSTTRYLYFKNSWGKRPSQIKNGSWGNKAVYVGDTTLETNRSSTVSNANGASISVNFPQSYGSQTFTSSEETQTTNLIGNLTRFRGSGSGLPWGGNYLVYDGGYSLFKYEYWSCEFAPGWIGATDESQVFNGNTQCWNNGA